jgi:hypothetical protein
MTFLWLECCRNVKIAVVDGGGPANRMEQRLAFHVIAGGARDQTLAAVDGSQ